MPQPNVIERCDFCPWLSAPMPSEHALAQYGWHLKSAHHVTDLPTALIGPPADDDRFAFAVNNLLDLLEPSDELAGLRWADDFPVYEVEVRSAAQHQKFLPQF